MAGTTVLCVGIGRISMACESEVVIEHRRSIILTRTQLLVHAAQSMACGEQPMVAHQLVRRDGS